MLCEASYTKLQKAKAKKEVVSEYVTRAVKAAIEKGMTDESAKRPENKKFIYIPNSIFYTMQEESDKLGITNNEFVRRAIRQHGT